MKQLLLLLLLLTASRLLPAQTDLLSKNIQFNNVRYEYKLKRTDDQHVQ